MATPEPTSAPRPRASISVIVPSYNCGTRIGEALDSILEQTVGVEQIIVVDDGSTDDTATVVGRYKNARIQYIQRPHEGMASACNAGLDAARSEFVTFLYAGDRWSPAFAERMHDYLTADPGIACAFSNFVHLDDSTGKMLGDQFSHYPEIKRPVLLRDAPNAHGRIPQERAFGALVSCSDIPAYLQVMMFRRSAIENLRFEPSLGPGADTSFALQAFMRGMIVFTDEVLALVRNPTREDALSEGALPVHTLNGLKALAPHVTRERDVTPYRERLSKAHIDAALSLMKAGQARAALRTYRGAFQFPGLRMRKFRGFLRLLVGLPRGLLK
ncbi:glycosyltransferase family 2 protein [Steroidobacter cummioxidans]|uniref:glycosyltransferase family 2 protein n=1 Tax=Steroidobacter cummioxidans TaxID=1803913 RepID=UPI00137A9CEC|nr:glycosyltransferase family 2 protein [Steroidobacter cummioxidans]